MSGPIALPSIIACHLKQSATLPPIGNNVITLSGRVGKPVSGTTMSLTERRALSPILAESASLARKLRRRTVVLVDVGV